MTDQLEVDTDVLRALAARLRTEPGAAPDTATGRRQSETRPDPAR